MNFNVFDRQITTSGLNKHNIHFKSSNPYAVFDVRPINYSNNEYGQVKVYSPIDGIIYNARDYIKGDCGKFIGIINNDYYIALCHFSKVLVNTGDKVKKGQQIGIMGTTGKSSGEHVHIQIYKKGYKSNSMFGEYGLLKVNSDKAWNEYFGNGSNWNFMPTGINELSASLLFAIASIILILVFI